MHIAFFNSAEYEIRLTKTGKDYTISAKFEMLGKPDKFE